MAVAFAAGLATGTMLDLIAPQSRAAAILQNSGASIPPIQNIARTSHPAEVLHVHDGDTFEARVRVWPGIEINTKVRLRGVDAPELNGRCREEYAKAAAARDALAVLLQEGDVTVFDVGLDKYGGRVVARAATRQTPDISRALSEAGLARRYDAGRRESWCS